MKKDMKEGMEAVGTIYGLAIGIGCACLVCCLLIFLVMYGIGSWYQWQGFKAPMEMLFWSNSESAANRASSLTRESRIYAWPTDPDADERRYLNESHPWINNTLGDVPWNRRTGLDANLKCPLVFELTVGNVSVNVRPSELQTSYVPEEVRIQRRTQGGRGRRLLQRGRGRGARRRKRGIC